MAVSVGGWGIFICVCIVMRMSAAIVMRMRVRTVMSMSAAAWYRWVAAVCRRAVIWAGGCMIFRHVDSSFLLVCIGLV